MEDICYVCEGTGIEAPWDLLRPCRYCNGTGDGTNIRVDDNGDVELYDTGWEEPTDIFSFLEVLPGPDWPEAEDNNYNGLLQSFDLKGIDLSNRNLSNLDFDGCDMRGANLTGCDLRRNSMRGADLRDAIFNACHLDLNHLARARISGTSFEGANVEGQMEEEFEFDPRSGSAPSFKGVIARNTGFLGNMAGWDFSNADLTDSRFSETNISGANLEGAIAIRASFEDAVVTNVHLLNACLEGADLARATLTGSVLQGVDFTGADFTEADIRNCDCRGSLIERGRSFSALTMDNTTILTDVQSAVLKSGGAVDGDFRSHARPGVRWNGVKNGLKNENLKGAPLKYADLSNSDLSRAALDDADLKSAQLVNANLSDATLNSADLSYAVLAGAILRNSRFVGANLYGADLTHADLSSAVLAPTNMRNAVLIGANLRKANIAGADLRGADLGYASLEGATVDEGILEASSLQYVDLTGVWGLSEPSFQKCLARGAIYKRVEASIDLRRALSLGGKRGNKYFGLEVQGKSRKREAAALDAKEYLENLDPVIRTTLMAALGDESVIGVNGVTEYRYLDQYGDLATRLIVALREAGFVISPKSKNA